MQQPAGAIPVDKLIPLLSDPDRSIRFAARVAIEHADLKPYRGRLLELGDSRRAWRECLPWSGRLNWIERHRKSS